MKFKIAALLACTVGVLTGLMFRLEDAECLWLSSQKTDMFSEINLCPQADRVAHSLLGLPTDTPSRDLHGYAAHTAFRQCSEADSPRQKALEILHANAITPNCLLKLRLQEITLACRIIGNHNAELGSHKRDVRFDYIDSL